VRAFIVVLLEWVASLAVMVGLAFLFAWSFISNS
jgi:hypothetical protein